VMRFTRSDFFGGSARIPRDPHAYNAVQDSFVGLVQSRSWQRELILAHVTSLIAHTRHAYGSHRKYTSEASLSSRGVRVSEFRRAMFAKVAV